MTYSVDSIAAVNFLVESLGKDVKPDKMQTTWVENIDLSLMLGAYIGESIIKSIGGKWIYEKGRPVVQTDLLIVNPYLMIEEGFREGNKAILKRYLYCIHYQEGCEFTITEKRLSN